MMMTGVTTSTTGPDYSYSVGQRSLPIAGDDRLSGPKLDVSGEMVMVDRTRLWVRVDCYWQD